MLKRKCKCLKNNHYLIKKDKYYYYSIFNGTYYPVTYTHYIYNSNSMTGSETLIEIYKKDEFDDMFIDAQEERRLKLEKLNDEKF